jgi:hypothetical protein
MGKHKPSNDQLMLECCWLLVALYASNYWGEEALERVRRSVKGKTVMNYSDRDLAILLEFTRAKISRELSIAPWEP